MFSPKKFPAVFVMAVILCMLSVCSALAYEGGYVPSPIDRSHLESNPPVIRRDSRNVGDTTIPESYDLRDVNSKSYLPSVRNQRSYGTCWAHAALGALESNYLMQGGTYLTGSEPDLSELHLSWFVYKDPREGHSFTMKDGNFVGGPVFGQGANADKVIALMSRLSVPVNESELPYTSIDADVSTMQETIPATACPEDYTLVMRLHDAYTLGKMTESLRDTVKQLIMDNGAVQISYYSRQTVAATSSGSDVSAYYKYDDNTYTYYDPATTTPNHAVLIVGWDDNFSAEKFDTSNKPSANGAWLVRNSWGSTWGNSGYFWMSYEQNITDVTAYIGEAVTGNMTVYYHDALGQCSMFGTSGSEGWAANVFKAEGANETLTQVSLITTENNAGYGVYVYKLGTTKPSGFTVTAEEAATKQTGTMTYAGYHVITLDDPVALDEGEYFAVVVNTLNTGTYNIAIERTVSYTSGGYYSQPVINSGESYFAFGSSFPSSWSDGYDGITFRGQSSPTPMNACIKAFTVTAAETITADKSTFPDEIFRSYVTETYGATPTKSALEAVTELNLSNKGIADFTGIEHFTGLTALDVSGNESAKVLDISNLTALTLDNITCDPGLSITNGNDTVVFEGHSLLLSGQIGVMFYVNVPDKTTYSTAAMTFTVNGTAGDPIAMSSAAEDSDGIYFICPINSIQMAEKITATFAYGDGLTVSNKCSASDYIDMVLSDTTLQEGDALLNIVNAIKDYGHYVQIPLADYHEWTIGTDYAEMTAATAYSDDTVSEAKTAVADYALTNTDINKTLIKSAQMDLELNSATTLNVYLTCATSATVTAADGITVTDTGNNTYTVTVRGISAHKLGNKYTINVTSGGTTYVITASALSYAYAVLNETGAEKYSGINNAVTALYNYYAKTMAYRNSDYWKNN